MDLSTTLTERFWAKVDQTETCWLWQGAVSSSGYGNVSGVDRRTRRAHRVAYELLVGPIPPGLQLDHLCRVRRCVNPSHLEVVTQTVNVLRGEGPTAKNATKTHCHRGHPLDKSNTRHRPSGGRTCRTCERIRVSQRQGQQPR